MNLDQLEHLESLLKQTHSYGYYWGKKQDNSWDSMTNFIYKAASFEQLIAQCRNKNFPQELENYAVNRWLNFQSAQAIESMFNAHPLVQPEPNKFHHSIDFYIDGLNFDHKTSVFPRRFNRTIQEALEDKEGLITWLYRNQSQQRRKHLDNRIFVITYDSQTSAHWQLKSDLRALYEIIMAYLDHYDSKQLITLDQGYLDNGIGNGVKVYSDIIWYIR